MDAAVAIGLLVLLWLAVWVLIPIFVAHSQGRSKNRAGVLYGLFLGWLGVLILALLPPRQTGEYGECPWCKEDIRVDALVCPHCQRDVTPLDAEGRPDYSRREQLEGEEDEEDEEADEEILEHAE